MAAGCVDQGETPAADQFWGLWRLRPTSVEGVSLPNARTVFPHGLSKAGTARREKLPGTTVIHSFHKH